LPKDESIFANIYQRKGTTPCYGDSLTRGVIQCTLDAWQEELV